MFSASGYFPKLGYGSAYAVVCPAVNNNIMADGRCFRIITRGVLLLHWRSPLSVIPTVPTQYIIGPRPFLYPVVDDLQHECPGAKTKMQRSRIVPDIPYELTAIWDGTSDVSVRRVLRSHKNGTVTHVFIKSTSIRRSFSHGDLRTCHHCDQEVSSSHCAPARIW